MDQGIFLFDNQYHPDVIDRVYHRVRETTWDHCMSIQKAMCQHKIFGGPLSDFTCDEELNARQGFPAGSYTTFIKEKLLRGNQKYILDHFIRNHELLSLREMLQNPRFQYQFIFHIADYTFMNLKCQIVQNGTYLVIPIDTVDGITKKQMERMLADYDNPYTPSRWLLEMRPKVSYAYGETTALKLIDNQNRIYLDQFTEKMQFYKSDAINDWKVCVSESTADLNLLRATPAVLGFDEADGRPYVEISQLFKDHITQATFAVHCFLYNEGHKVGFTISPNYIGPSQYLKTTFDEYIATVEAQRLKVAAMNADGGWTTLTGADKQFGTLEDLVAVGFYHDECWISIPTGRGVCPIYPGNFRVWEYDRETDTLGRMVAHDMTAAFPNMYFYKMKSDAYMLYIEWFRDDETVGTEYDDFTEFYRDYIGPEFPFKLVNGELPRIMTDFKPVHSEFSATDFVKHILMYSSHEYRIVKMAEILQESGMHYDEIVNNIDGENAMYTTITYDLENMPELYERLKSEGSYGTICIATSGDTTRPYDLYIDGVHISRTQTFWREFNQYITVPKELIHKDSIIIIDLYDYAPQASAPVIVTEDFLQSLIPDNFPIRMISANDIVVTDEDGLRIDPSRLVFGLYANEFLVQIPVTMIDWDALGIDKNDPAIADRLGIMHPTGIFQAVVFRLILPTSADFSYLTTSKGETLYTSLSNALKVKSGNVFVTTEGYDEIDPTKMNKFSKKVKAQDLAIKIQDIGNEEIMVRVHNNTVYRKSTARDLSKSNQTVITSFCGADDPTRLISFVNGILRGNDAVSGQIPEKINSDFTITFNGSFNPGDEGEVVYLPFPTDRFDLVSDENGLINLATKGVMVVGVHDMIYENGFRIPNDQLIRVTNQLIKAPKPNTLYTIVRMHRDSNLYGFNDVNNQSFMDILFNQSPGYKQHVLDNLDAEDEPVTFNFDL